MSLTPQELDAQLTAACPGILNSLGDWNDKSTWILRYPDSATDAEKAAAQAVVDAAPVPLIMAHRYVAKLDIIDRLNAAGKLDAVLPACSSLSDADKAKLEADAKAAYTAAAPELKTQATRNIKP